MTGKHHRAGSVLHGLFSLANPSRSSRYHIDIISIIIQYYALAPPRHVCISIMIYAFHTAFIYLISSEPTLPQGHRRCICFRICLETALDIDPCLGPAVNLNLLEHGTWSNVKSHDIFSVGQWILESTDLHNTCSSKITCDIPSVLLVNWGQVTDFCATFAWRNGTWESLQRKGLTTMNNMFRIAHCNPTETATKVPLGDHFLLPVFAAACHHESHRKLTKPFEVPCTTSSKWIQLQLCDQLPRRGYCR